MPPRPSLDDLTDHGMIVADSYKEPEEARSLFRLRDIIAIIQRLVESLHELDVDRVHEVRFLHLGPVYKQPVPFGNWYVEIL